VRHQALHCVPNSAIGPYGPTVDPLPQASVSQLPRKIAGYLHAVCTAFSRAGQRRSTEYEQQIAQAARVGPAYALWTGIGAAGTAAVGMIVLGESVSVLKIVSIGLVLAGIVGLNLSGVTP